MRFMNRGNVDQRLGKFGAADRKNLAAGLVMNNLAGPAIQEE
jgi:hypothetical protein